MSVSRRIARQPSASSSWLGQRIESFYVLHTRSGSLYVLVMFDPGGARRSLDAYNRFSNADLNPNHGRLQ